MVQMDLLTLIENPIPKIFKSNRIASFSEDLNGKIWIGTFQSGLISYDPVSGETFQIMTLQVFVKTVLTEPIR